MTLIETPPRDRQQEYYDDRWGKAPERPNRLELLRLLEIFRALYATQIDFAVQPVRICDLGCGRGSIAYHLSQFGEVTAIDLSSEAIRIAQARWPHIRFEQGDITNYQRDEKYDIVVSSEVIEHIRDKSAFFYTIRHILKPGGHLIITAPNKNLFAYYSKSDAEMQPVEQWPSLADIRRLALPDFHIIRHECFLFDFYYTGIFRWPLMHDGQVDLDVASVSSTG